MSDDIKLGELEFQPEDLKLAVVQDGNYDPEAMKGALRMIADEINRILREKLGNARLLCGREGAMQWFELPGMTDTHFARLVAIEEIVTRDNST